MKLTADGNPTHACPTCGTWVCGYCEWKRSHANRYSANIQVCARCGSTDGHMNPVFHVYAGYIEDHDEFAAYNPLPPRYPLENGS